MSEANGLTWMQEKQKEIIVHAYIKRRDDNGAYIVGCPFCEEEHYHYNSGLTLSVCGRGEYSVVNKVGGNK